MVRHMMRTTKIGRKLQIMDLLQAARTMAAAQRLDFDVAVDIFRIQFPQFMRGVESDYFDMFNMFKNTKNRRWWWHIG